MFTPITTEQKIAESYAPGVKVTAYKKESDLIPITIFPPVGMEGINDAEVIPAPPRMVLQPFQREGVLAMARRGNALLADEQGLGKTAQVISLINYKKPKKVLIVCPKTLIFNWESELISWLANSEAKIVMHAAFPAKILTRTEIDEDMDRFNFGTKAYSYKMDKFNRASKDRVKCDDNHPKFDVLIVQDSTFQSPKTIGNLMSLIKATKFDFIAIDEVHRFKSPSAKRTITLFGDTHVDPETGEYTNRGCIRGIKTKIFMSGTPIVNAKLSEIYHMLAMLSPRAFGSKETFVERFQTTASRGSPTETKNEEMLAIQLRESVMIRRLARDVLSLPHMIRDIVELADTPVIVKARALLEEAILKLMKEKSGSSSSVFDIPDIEALILEATNNVSESIMEEYEAKTQSILDAVSEDSDLTEDEIGAIADSAESEADRTMRLQATGNQKLAFEVMSIARKLLGEAKGMACPPAIYQYLKNLNARGLWGTSTTPNKAVIFFHHRYNMKVLRDGIIDVFNKEYARALLPHNEAQYNRLKLSEKNFVGIMGGMPDIARQDAVERFQKDPEIKFFLGNISTASVGITLTAANVVMFVEQDWTPAAMQQAACRIYRIGQKARTVHSAVFVVGKSIDSNIARNLVFKMDFQKRILDIPPDQSLIARYKRDFQNISDPSWKYSGEVRTALDTILKRFKIAIEAWGPWSASGKDDRFAPPEASRPLFTQTIRDRLNDYFNEGTKYVFDEHGSWKSVECNGSHAKYTSKFDESFVTDFIPVLWAARGWISEALTLGSRGRNRKEQIIPAQALNILPVPPELKLGSSSNVAFAPLGPSEGLSGGKLSFLRTLWSASGAGLKEASKRNRRAAIDVAEEAAEKELAEITRGDKAS